MSSLTVSASQFEVIETSLNIELIIPVLEDFGLLSSADKQKLAEKSQKQAVKFILKKVKQHPESSKLFRDVLEKTNKNAGHQKILQVLYPAEDLDLHIDGMVNFVCSHNSYSSH